MEARAARGKVIAGGDKDVGEGFNRGEDGSSSGVGGVIISTGGKNMLIVTRRRDNATSEWGRCGSPFCRDTGTPFNRA